MGMNRVQRSKKRCRSVETGLTGVIFRTAIDALRTLAAGPPAPLKTDDPTPQEIRNHRNALLEFWDAALFIFTDDQDHPTSFDSLMDGLNSLQIVSFTPEWMRRKLKELGYDPFHWRFYVSHSVGGDVGRSGCEQHIRSRNEVLAADDGYTATGVWDLIAACESAVGRLAEESLRDDRGAGGEPAQKGASSRVSQDQRHH